MTNLQKYLFLAVAPLILSACSPSETSAPVETPPEVTGTASDATNTDTKRAQERERLAVLEREAKAQREAQKQAEQEQLAEAARMAEIEAKKEKHAMIAAEASQEQERLEQARQAKEAMLAEEARIAEAARRLEAANTAQAPVQAPIQAPGQPAEVNQETLTALPSIPVITPAAPEAPEVVKPPSANAPFNAFLSKYVIPQNGINLVAYDRVTPADRATLQAYISKLSAMNIEALPRDQEMATWFNLYNARTIELILENYPTKSIRKIRSPWKRDRMVVNGKNMSLDDIEHGTVRKKYNEPRVHYAFNCASIGCPNIKATAWEAATLEADLTSAARDFVASDRGVRVDSSGRIIASSIFKWYKDDFGGSEASILRHLRQYASGSKKAALDAAGDIAKFDYDWDLNIPG